jgi:hypothetical protein
MTRLQLRRLFRKHRGAFARLARELELKPTTVSNWFSGRFDSARIESAAAATAKELLHEDAQNEAAKAQSLQKLKRLRAVRVSRAKT